MRTEHLSSILASIAPALANHVWQSTVFAALVGLLTVLLRKNQARIRYSLWLVASIKFLVPFSLLVAVGGLLPKPHHVGSQTALYSALNEAGQPFSGTLMSPNVSATPVTASTYHLATWLATGLMAAWLCGILAFVMIWIARWWRVSMSLRSALRVEHGRETNLLRQLEDSTGTRAGIVLLLSRESMEPGIFGIFRPVLIWPEGLSERLEDEHMKAILAHEMFHWQRLDNLTAAVHMVVEAAFWFHPVVWWMERRLVEERERACDEAVVQLGGEPGSYAEGLLKACRFCVESPLVCVSGITGASLNKRIVFLMTKQFARTLGPTARLLLGLCALAAVAGPITFGLVGAAQKLPTSSDVSGPHAAFEVATIKPSDPLNSHQHLSMSPGGRLNATISVEALIERAYGIHDFQVLGAPKWADTAKYDIVAKSDEPEDPSKLSPDQQDAYIERQKQRLQSLLADRFQLKFHSAVRQLPIFALVVTKGGPKLRAPKIGEAHRLYTQGPGQLACFGASMSELAAEFPDLGVSRVVLDKTGLTGRYDFSLQWTPDDSPGGAPLLDSSGGSLFTALQEQLGLKLEPQKGPVEVLVIDHVARPSEN
jgi:bla regulator protein BlaR1